MPGFEQISLRDDLYAPLVAYAKEHNCTKQEVIRMALRDFFAALDKVQDPKQVVPQ